MSTLLIVYARVNVVSDAVMVRSVFYEMHDIDKVSVLFTDKTLRHLKYVLLTQKDNMYAKDDHGSSVNIYFHLEIDCLK